MKAIITRAHADGSYSNVGTNERTILTYKKESKLYKFARSYAKTMPFRLEIWNNEADFRDCPPDEVRYDKNEILPSTTGE